MNNDSKHTPGPWATLSRFPDKIVPAAHRDRSHGGSIDEDYDREHYAVVIASAEHNDHSGFAHEISKAQAHANARLIAAAPDLLHELRTSRCPGGGYTGQPEGEEPTVDNCLKAGMCGCTAGAVVKKAIGA